MTISKKYTIANVKDMENHAELIGGKLVITDPTTTKHNLVIKEIEYALDRHIRDNNCNCTVFTENVALFINELYEGNESYFLPDVMVVCEPDSFDENGVHKTPVFVAEVTSEQTRKHDYNFKLETYKRIGVEEYWIVDIQRNQVYKYLAKEDYIPQTYMNLEEIEFSVYDGLKVTLSNL